MKRTPRKRTPMKRAARKSGARITRPVGERFNAWVCRVVRERDRSCQRCGALDRLDRAHIFGLGMGGSRYDALNWRNWPSASVLLCRPCHEGRDQRQTWTWAEIGIDLHTLDALERAARAECWGQGERWEEKPTRAKPTPRRKVA